jgi:hypothetical protein
VGFSLDGQYIAAFDAQHAFIWSSTSFQVVAQHSIENPNAWFLNTNHPSVMPPLELPDDVILTPVFEPSRPISSLSCVLFTLNPRSIQEGTKRRFPMPTVYEISRFARAVPLRDSNGNIWLRGRRILTIPAVYCDPKSCSSELLPCARIPGVKPDFLMDFTLSTSRDGTRFLICDKEGSPVVVDMSGVINSDLDE